MDGTFPRYTEFDPKVPVWCVTPNTGRVLHRFYDTSPFSPSGKYIALTRFPYENRVPTAGDVAQVLLVDLQSGAETVLAETRGWDAQLGAQVQWGASDEELFFNDVEVKAWRPFGIKLNPKTGACQQLDGSIYNVSADARWSASPCLLRTARTQAGYGVIVPPEMVPVNRGAPEDDGIYLTDLQSGKARLLLSIAELLRRYKSSHELPDPRRGDYYGFHAKWNPQGTRLLFILRWAPRNRSWLGRVRDVPKSQMKKNVLSIEMNGGQPGEVHVAIPDTVWYRGGHHPNWCPDGEHVLMNLNLTSERLRIAQVRYDGEDLHALSATVVGSGHPSMHRSGRYILTDAYPSEPVAFGDGTIPIRLADLQTQTEETLVRIRTRPDFRGPNKEMRVDAHPAWDSTFTRLAFNACPDGTRRVYVADLSGIVNR